jgi:hypothetical protein
VVAALLLLAAPSLAGPGVPGPDWFTGRYERVGRDAAGRLVDDQVRIVPDRGRLRVDSCMAPPLLLAFDPYGARENALSGAGIDCLFHADASARPILTCRTAGGAFTLWPLPDAPPDCG